MADIDIGAPAINRGNKIGLGFTLLAIDNPANAAGTITKVEIWANENLGGCKAGTFYGSGTSYTNRDSHVIGNVASGGPPPQTFTGLDIDVESGDYIGTYYSSGFLEYEYSGYGGTYYKTGDQFGAGQQTYTLLSGDVMSLYGEGDLPPAAIPRYGVIMFQTPAIV